jgi:CubicO group peptidase (beta-lactamase class C family)
MPSTLQTIQQTDWGRIHSHLMRGASGNYRPFMLVLAFFLVLSAVPVMAQGTTLTEALDTSFNQQVERHRLTGLAAVVVDRNGIIYAGGFGDLTANTPLPVASISKSFTAIAVMQQVEAGHIALDDPVQMYLPWFGFEDMTVRQLLNQVSGLGDVGYPPSNFVPETTLEVVVRDIAEKAVPVSSAGSAYHYFNPNYQVLGLIVEQVSGQAFPDYLQKHIFDPLGMAHTTTMPPLSPAELPQGHLTAFGLPVAANETVYGEYVIPSGGIVSTAQDMGRYLTMQLNAGAFASEEIVTPQSIDLMHTPPPTIDSLYAMGWKTGTISGVPVLEHGGDLNTYHAQMVLLPQHGMGFILLVNQNGFLHHFTSYPELTTGLVALLTGQTPAELLSMRALGSGMLAVALVTLALESWGIVRLWRHRNRWGQRPTWRLLVMGIIHLLPLAFLLALPYLVWLMVGRFAGYGVLFVLQPDIMLWLTAVAGMHIVQLGVKVWMHSCYKRHGSLLCQIRCFDLPMTHQTL